MRDVYRPGLYATPEKFQENCHFFYFSFVQFILPLSNFMQHQYFLVPSTKLIKDKDIENKRSLWFADYLHGAVY